MKTRDQVMKTFQQILEEEFEKQSFVVREMEAELERLMKNPDIRSRDVVELMNDLFAEKRALTPLKKVFEAYKKQQGEK
jgi:hypothetical protein